MFRDSQLEIELAENFSVAESEARSVAAEHMVRLALEIKKLLEIHDPVCQARHEAWKNALADRKAVIEPRETAKRIYGEKVALFDAEEKRRAQEQQLLLLAAERERAELERETSIEMAEQSGASAEEIRALCDAPVVVAPVIRSRGAAKTPVGTRFQPKGRVSNLLAFVRHAAEPGQEHLVELLEVNETMLNKLVAATNGAIKLPGIEIYQQPVSTTRTKGVK